jgi:NADH:ubiquinone oxidoreductase subunit E
VQAQKGWRSRGAIAKVTGSLFGRVHETAKFYSMFKFRPPCKHVLERCNGLSCFIHDSEKLKAAIKTAAGARLKTASRKMETLVWLEMNAQVPVKVRRSSLSMACTIARLRRKTLR